MIILLHSSKTMARVERGPAALRPPLLLDRAVGLATYLKGLTTGQLARCMELSPALAEKTRELLAAWTADPAQQSPAVDSFRGDIYSGLHANDLAPADRAYANQSLWILSGLYGILRPDDGICPYRLEMGYRLPDPPFANLYSYWGESIAGCLPDRDPMVNLAAAEYAQTVTRFVDPARVVAPRFLTQDPKTGQPGFVVVHAKIARGAFARWLITERVQNLDDLVAFAEIGYRHDPALSTPDSPTFVCKVFEGKGLSIRLK
jgi:cytoplasmic iron level regulating protein YaaA (DUF328/UPF0246 family)